MLGAKVSRRKGNPMPLYGYARVSTREQDLAAQDAELRAAGCVKTFKEKVSGAKTDRPELAKLIRRLDDTLVVTRCVKTFKEKVSGEAGADCAFAPARLHEPQTNRCSCWC